MVPTPASSRSADQYYMERRASSWRILLTRGIASPSGSPQPGARVWDAHSGALRRVAPRGEWT